MRFLVVFSVLFALCAGAPKDKRSTILVSEAVQPVVVSPNFYTVPAVSHSSRFDGKVVPVVSQAYYTSPIVESIPVVAPASEVKSVVVPVEKTYVGGSAVSHQSRVDVKSYPSIVTEHLVAPAVVETAPSVVDARSVYLTPAVYQSASAVSHQSRVDVKTSPAVVSHQFVSPVVNVHPVYAF
ncbi:unnamed protein product [Pieris brassicae]|uniref:Cuticle protein n=1 Tax=Pieris brassicae TaxID=7116 RepID=A0A9P0XA95_PIEBR|nr:unnamed protein product [Pieris brassicae]